MHPGYYYSVTSADYSRQGAMVLLLCNSMRLRFCLSIAAPLLCTLLVLISAPLQAADSGSSADKGTDPVLVQGYLSGKYVFRKTRVDDEKIRDEDLSTDLRIDLSKPQSNGYEFHFFGTLRDDLSSNRDRTGYSPFEDIGNAYRSRTHGYVYEAHLDLNDPFSHVTQVRIGRQDGTRDEPIFFDGISADFRVAPRISVTAYGGAAVNLYELDNRWGSDSLHGIGLDLYPASATVVNLDYLYVDDKRGIFDTTSQRDQLISLKLNQRFSPNLRTSAKLRYINGDPRDMEVRVVGTAPETGIELNAAYVRQFRVQNELSNELSPYYDVIGQSEPYQSYDVKVRTFFGTHVAVDMGYFKRALIHTELESAFNRAYTRSYAVLDITNLAVSGLSLSFTGEQWTAGHQHLTSTGYDVGYAFKAGRRSPKVSAGSYYSLYKYDYYLSLGERTNVRTYYVKGEYPFAERYSFSCGYEIEHGIETYQTAKLGLRYAF